MATSRIMLPALLLLLASATLNAAVVISGTGLTNPDTNYSLSNCTGCGGSTSLVLYAHPAYAADTATSKWVSPDANGCVGCTAYSITTTFTLTAQDVANAMVQGMWGVDNGAQIFLNGAAAVGTGTSLASSNMLSNFLQLNPFTITSGFQAGVNTLRIDVVNDATDGGPTAIRLEGTVQTGAVPEPFTLGLVGSGFLALVLYRGRRKA